jgi:hypothetical protein
VHLDFKTTNNMAEYETLIFGLSTTLSLGVRQLLVKGDSQLIIKQVKGKCSCNDPQLVIYLLHAQKIEKDFEALDLQHIPHANNVVADELSTKVSMWAPVPEGIFEQRLQRPTTQTIEPGEGGNTNTSKLVVQPALFTWSPPKIVGITGDTVNPGAQDPDAQASPNAWITEIWDYLKDNILLDEHVSAEQIVRVAKRYTLVEGDLYRSGAKDVLMRCITREDGCSLVAKIHGGECGNNASSRMLVGKAFRHGFYWPTTL